MASKQTNWEKQTLELIAEEDAITYLGATHPSLEPHEHPNFKVWNYSPNKLFDGDTRYKIAGPEHSIILQSSLLTAWHDIWAKRNAFIRFEDWFELWEDGFKPLITRPDTNFPVSGKDQWRKDNDSKPKFKQWKNANSKAKINRFLKVIEYWPDRSDKGTSFILSGSDIDLIQQIIRIHSESGGINGGDKQNYKSEYLSFKGIPKVILDFREKTEDVEKGYVGMQSRIGFHLIGKSENPNSDLEKLTENDIKNLATKIRDAFVKPEPYKIHRGKETVSIKDKNRGYDSYIHVYNKSDGLELYSKICNLNGHTLDTKRVSHKVTIDEVGAYPITQPELTVLGKKIKPARIRPVGYVHFYEARLFLSLVPVPIKLCNAKEYLFTKLNTEV